MSAYSPRKRAAQAKAAARQAFKRATTWPDLVILDTINVGGMLTERARARALELAKLGLLDVSGIWKLTPAGLTLLKGR